MTMMAASGEPARILVMISGPLIPGSRRSMRVMSGRCSVKAAIAAAPSPASATTFMSGSASMVVRRPTRTTGWSSTISTRIFFSAVVGSGIRTLRLLSGHGHGDLDPGPRPRPAVDGERSQALVPLPHSGQPDVPGLRPLGQRGIEAPAVVGHAEADPILLEGEGHLDAA